MTYDGYLPFNDICQLSFLIKHRNADVNDIPLPIISVPYAGYLPVPSALAGQLDCVRAGMVRELRDLLDEPRGDDPGHHRVHHPPHPAAHHMRRVRRGQHGGTEDDPGE